MEFDNNMEFIDLFEKKLSEYTGFKYAVVCDCCTNGILISLELLHKLNIIDKDKPRNIPTYTYMSVPMTLRNYGWNIRLSDIKWKMFYEIEGTKVYDSAVFFGGDMSEYFQDNSLVCVSFQQKKRLSLGRGGAILTNNENYYKILKRMVYDGRNSYISDRIEISENPDDIIRGFHCYMEPDKAVKGVLKLNQPQMLPPFIVHDWTEYKDLRGLKHVYW